ncbi:MAG TPA: hypothetical protein VLI68_09210 [Hanamia sp.]|jgi:hypothetical protein|nr:hypothetical protein [Hanamia sp.]
MKKVFVFLFAFIFMGALAASAQTYQTALGAKFYTGDGSIGGVNVRHSTAVNTALEGSLLFFNGGIGIEGLYQYQGPISGAEGLQYFVGGGAMLGFGTGPRYNDNHNNSTTFALRLTGGVDYKFADAPIDVSLGLDPFFYLAPYTGSNLSLGIGLRYVIK